MQLILFNIERNSFCAHLGADLTGKCVVKELNKLEEGIRILLTEGDARYVIDPDGRESEIIEYLQSLETEGLFERIYIYAEELSIDRFGSVSKLQHIYQKGADPGIHDELKAIIEPTKNAIQTEKMRVLAIDDVVIIRNIIRTIFDKSSSLSHLEVITAGSVAEAKSVLANKEGIELVILDWMMPKISGIDFLRYLRSDNRYKSVKVIMCTSVGERAKVKEAIGIGVDGYIVKPIVRADLVKKVVELLPMPVAG
jgi:two-component system, chemotaxis family, chemotaxis protein CheY